MLLSMIFFFFGQVCCDTYESSNTHQIEMRPVRYFTKILDFIAARFDDHRYSIYAEIMASNDDRR